MNLNERLQSRLKSARKELQISQFEFGVRAEIDEGTAKSRISHYENGISSPPYGVVPLLAKACLKPISWFFCEDDEKNLLSALHNLPKADRRKMIQILERTMLENMP